MENLKHILKVLIFVAFINSIKAQNAVGINTTVIDAGTILDISSLDKGVLIPRVSLLDVTNTIIPINSPETGLLVWNSNSTVTNGNGVGFYYYSGTQWEKFQVPNTLDSAYDEGGAGNGKQIIADAGSVKINGLDGFYITGTFSSGINIDTEESGAGTRMFFNPNNASFKAGETLGGTFSDNQSRNYSFGVGNNIENRAGRSFVANNNTGANTQGTNASAFGNLSEGRQNSSFATGLSNISSQNNAIVFGELNNSKGKSSFSAGNNVIAESVGEIAFGSYARQYSRFDQSEEDANPSNDQNDSHFENYQEDRIFVIGNGTSSSSNNALEIWKTGIIEINEAYELPVTDGAVNNILQTDGVGVLSWQAQANVVDPFTHLEMFNADVPFIMNNTGANIDIQNFDLGLVPTVFDTLGDLQVRMVIYYTSKTGSTPTFRVRADNGTISSNILGAGTFTDTPIVGGSGIVSTPWRNWNAGVTPYEIHLNGSVGAGDSMSIVNAYFLVKQR